MNLQDGDRLTADTFSDAGLHILGKGTVIKSEDISLLMQHRVDYVDIESREEEITEAEFLPLQPNLQPVRVWQLVRVLRKNRLKKK